MSAGKEGRASRRREAGSRDDVQMSKEGTARTHLGDVLVPLLLLGRGALT